MNKTIAPYGSWKSPITTDLMTAKTVSLVEACVDGEDIYWIESRPLEMGRYVIMRRTPDGNVTECTPPDFNARTAVHEYGGGAPQSLDQTHLLERICQTIYLVARWRR